MSEETPNKVVAILKTSFIVSLICGAFMGGLYTLRHGQTVTEFLTVTYLAFINKLIMPVGIATIVNYIFIRKNFRDMGNSSRITKFLTLSVIAFAFLFIWNGLEVFFKWENLMHPDRFISSIGDEFVIGLVLCTPVAIMVMLVYSLFRPRT